MDFGKKQLEKYGWKEGQGLGKEGDGIIMAIKPKLKFDKFGIGHDHSEPYTNNWWERLYDNACSNVNITNDKGRVAIRVEDPDILQITTSRSKVNKFTPKDCDYGGSFLKTSTLTPSGLLDLGINYDADDCYGKVRPLTDDELFAACGRRTAHKAAGHGNGKLSRIEKQEKLLLKQLKRVSLSDETNSKLEKKLKKISEHKSRNSCDIVEDDGILLDLPSGNQCLLGSPSSHKCKKRKKERRRVSFNVTVTEFQTHTACDDETPSCSNDIASQSDGNSRPSTPAITVRLLKIKEKGPDNNGNLSPQDKDEGIDCTNYDEAKETLAEKVKKDNKQMKRKLKKLRSLLAKPDCNLHDHLETNCSKRKLFDDTEDLVQVELKKCHYDANSISNIKLTKRQRRELKKQNRLEKQVDKVADSLDQLCVI